MKIPVLIVVLCAFAVVSLHAEDGEQAAVPYAGRVVEAFDNGSIVDLSSGGEGVTMGMAFIYGLDNASAGEPVEGTFWPCGTYSHTAADDETTDMDAYALTKELAEKISARGVMGLD